LRSQDSEQAEATLAQLLAHPLGVPVGKVLNEQLDRLLVHLLDYYHGLQRVTPEWYWRDSRLRLSDGRNHRSDQRLERASLLWAIYHNFEPAQQMFIYSSSCSRQYGRRPARCSRLRSPR
jgi:hypothetical protein